MNKEILRFTIIRQNVKIIHRRNAIILTALLLYPIVVLIFNPKPGSFLNIFTVSVFILLLIFFAIYRKKTNPFLTVGLLTFSDEILTICDKSFNAINISDIKITYGGFTGEESALAPLGIDLIGNKEGGKNYINLLTKDGEKLKYRFLCTRESDLKNLNIIITEYQKKGINARLVKKSE